MPGRISDLVWNEPANLVHALGESPEGGPTVYVVEPHGNAVFADAPLPLEPSHLLVDTQPERPDEDRGELLAVAGDGSLASVDIDRNAFGWRLPGMLMGALMVALLYLLARVLFARRSVGLLAALLAIAEGMLFANSRIGMNDVYVTTFVVAAALLVAPLYLAPRRPWVSVILVLGAGLALGLALASKWVALYAIGGLLLLVLLRSVLGRAMALVGMIGLTAIFGAAAVQATPPADARSDWTFLLLMLWLTGLLAAAIVRRPLVLHRGEIRLAALGSLLVGLLLVAADVLPTSGQGGWQGRLADILPDGRLLVAGVLVMLAGLAIALLTWAIGRLGQAAQATPAPQHRVSSFLHPGIGGGLAWLVTLASLALLPLGVYVLSYAPWVELGNAWGLPLLGNLPFLPAGSDGGRTLADLTRSMYEYHDLLRAQHAASSPWWAWPLDLKPVWFFSEDYAGDRTGLIYDSGNLVVFWLGIAGMAFAAFAAWQRRSLSLAMIVILWASLWLPWARIDRATFQYHIYASIPFMVLALAYFLAELWHGPAGRTWLMARAAAALAILAAPLLWLLRTPLCILAGTATANPDGVACSHEVTRTALVSEAFSAAVLAVAAGTLVAALPTWRAARLGARSRGYADTSSLVLLVVVALLTLAGVAASFFWLDTTSPVPVSVGSDAIALLALAALSLPAWFVLRARDPRRFVLGVLAAALLWLLLWYPNLSGLPLPADFASAYQYVLPTWDWSFQFDVNTDPATGQGPGSGIFVIGALAVAVAVGAAVAAWRWGRDAREPVQSNSPAAILPGSRGT